MLEAEKPLRTTPGQKAAERQCPKKKGPFYTGDSEEATPGRNTGKGNAWREKNERACGSIS